METFSHNGLLIGFLSIILFSLQNVSAYKNDFLAPLSNRLTPGQIITIDGKTGNAKNETSFNLQCGDCNDLNGCDIVLHLVTRFSLNTAVRNSYLENRWLIEEMWGGSPFKPNTQYQLKIIIHNAFIELKINGKYFCTYKSELPLDKVNYIYIKSPGEVNSVSVTKDNILEELTNINTDYDGILDQLSLYTKFVQMSMNNLI